MATPDLGTRGDIVVQVEFDPVAQPGVFTNVCGVTNATFTMNNEVIATKVGDCDDWGAAVQTARTYAAQDVTIDIDAQWVATTYRFMFDWANLQQTLNVRISFPNATSGQLQFVDGAAVMATKTLDGIGNVDGNPQTASVSLQYDGGIVPTYVP